MSLDLSPLAVPYTLGRVGPLLPAPPAWVVEVGCGRGALAAALAARGYRVTGVEPDGGAAAAARARGVAVLPVDVREVPAGPRWDVLLFTRSLHAVDDLDGVLRHALTLLPAGGLVVVEEFAWERADAATAGLLYDSRALAVAAGALRLPDGAGPVDAAGDPLARWRRERGHLHAGARIVEALERAGVRVGSRVDTEAVWRLVAPPAARWLVDADRARSVLDVVRRVEARRITEGGAAAVGMVVAGRSGRVEE
jgi:SAM-dependent methyltransferase